MLAPTPAIRSLATAVPERRYSQAFARERMAGWLTGDRRTERILQRIYRHSGIDARHSVVDDFATGEGDFVAPDGAFRSLGTGARNARYAAAAPALYREAARRALSRAPGVAAGDISHVITVSCTGFYAPGPDLELVRDLELDPRVERYHLGFMGCYAAMPALRMAAAFCRADPDAVVLLASAELCTLHLEPRADLDGLTANAVFADGAAAAVVSAVPNAGSNGAPALELTRFASDVVPEGAGDMAWAIGDHGFEMTLSSYVPALLEGNAERALEPLLKGLDRAALRRWAIHPGGRAILDKLERSLALPEGALTASREVLRRYGNMSSATVLFVLEALLAEGGDDGEPLLAAAFGPGLTVDGALLTYRA